MPDEEVKPSETVGDALGEDEGGTEFERLADEGETLPEEGEEQEEEQEEEQPDQAGLDALRNDVADVRAENKILLAEIQRLRNAPAPKVIEPTIEPKDDIDLEDLVRRVTDKDPKIGVKAIMEVAGKIADKQVKAALKDARGYVDESQAERSLKEADLSSTMGDFDEDFNHYGQPFIDQVGTFFQENLAANGGKYTKKAMWNAAAAAKVMFDKRAAGQRGTKNGVTRVRPQQTPNGNRVESSTESYAGVKTISGIPDTMMSPREKAAARRVAQQMGVKESEWVANYFNERKDNPGYGV